MAQRAAAFPTARAQINPLHSTHKLTQLLQLKQGPALGSASALPLLLGLASSVCKESSKHLPAFKSASFLMNWSGAFGLAKGPAAVCTCHIREHPSDMHGFTQTHSHTHMQQSDSTFKKHIKCIYFFFLFKAVQTTKELSHFLFLETSTTRIFSRNLICTQYIRTS